MGTLDAYQWDTTRHILVSDKSRKVPGADDIRDWNWGLREAMQITLRSHLSFNLIEWRFSRKESANKTPDEVDTRPSALCTGYRLSAWATPGL